MKRIIYSFYIDIPKDELDIFDKNESIFDGDISIDQEIIKRYNERMIVLNEQFSALIDYEQYQSNYDQNIQELLREDSVNKQTYTLGTLTKLKALKFLEQFETADNVELQIDNIEIQNYEECLEV